MKKSLRNYLWLTGISVLSFFVLVFLHNALYALGMIINNMVSDYLVGPLSTISFLLAIFITPITFLVGVIGIIVSLLKRNGK